MKQIAFASTLIALIGLLTVVPARISPLDLTANGLNSIPLPDAVETYEDSLAGTKVNPSAPGHFSFQLQATGDLTGSYLVRIDYATDGSAVTGGTWALETQENGSTSGKLRGEILGGSVTLNSSGELTSLNSISLAIKEGAGRFASVSTGNGTLILTKSEQDSESFTGSLSLNF